MTRTDRIGLAVALVIAVAFLWVGIKLDSGPTSPNPPTYSHP